MNKIASFIFGTIIGASAGAIVTIKIMDNKYQEKYEQEVDMVKQAYKKLNKRKVVTDKEDSDETTVTIVEPGNISADSITNKNDKKNFIKEYKGILKDNYQKYYSEEKKDEEDEEDTATHYYDEDEERLVNVEDPDNEEWTKIEKPTTTKDKTIRPYTITPEEVGDGYRSEMLIYFEDGVLTDDDYNEVSDINGTIGLENIKDFGK